MCYGTCKYGYEDRDGDCTFRRTIFNDYPCDEEVAHAEMTEEEAEELIAEQRAEEKFLAAHHAKN